MRKVNPNGSTM